jgi:hypothetical protein
MAIAIACACGKAFNLKDELLGRLVKCPSCGSTMKAEGKPVEVRRINGLDPLFERDKFLLRQKKLAINEKYYVWDEGGRDLLFIERPRHMLRNLAAAVATAITLVAGVCLACALGASIDGVVGTVILAIGVCIALAATVFVLKALIKRRDVTVYRDETRAEPLLRIFQDKKMEFFVGTYTCATPDGQVLALLHKNYLSNILRKTWRCKDPDGTVRYVIREDSILLSLLRRLLGPLFGLLRTNFIICSGDQVIGEFNRKFTLFDRYVLDLSRDRSRTLDRRVALAIGVMLDTGERR